MFGAHISIKNGIINAFNTLKKYDKQASVMQIFVDNPRSSRSSNLKKYTTDDIKNIVEARKKNGIDIFIHSPYVINLAKDDPTNQIKLLINELQFAEKIESVGVIVHMGKHLVHKRDVALNNMYKNIKTILKEIKTTKLILETSCGSGTELCYDLVEFGDLYKKFSSSEKKKLGICIDSCHLFAAGYDLSTSKSIDTFFELFDKLLGIKNITVCHLNNSQKPLGSKVDRHANLEAGMIPKKSIQYFINRLNKFKIPMILETPDTDYVKDLKLIHKSL